MIQSEKRIVQVYARGGGVALPAQGNDGGRAGWGKVRASLLQE